MYFITKPTTTDLPCSNNLSTLSWFWQKTENLCLVTFTTWCKFLISAHYGKLTQGLTVKSTKYFWLFSPTQLLTQGQWWSIFRIQRLQTLWESQDVWRKITNTQIQTNSPTQTLQTTEQPRKKGHSLSFFQQSWSLYCRCKHNLGEQWEIHTYFWPTCSGALGQAWCCSTWGICRPPALVSAEGFLCIPW